MELVIDAGIIFTGLTGFGVTKKIIFLKNLRLYSPNLLLEELNEHKQRIIELSSLCPNEIEELIELIKERISFIPENSFESFLEQANSSIPDKEDTSYLALALSKSIPIWSNDSGFKKQSLAEVFNTKDLVEKLKSLGINLE